jgi:hypothetical protein
MANMAKIKTGLIAAREAAVILGVVPGEPTHWVIVTDIEELPHKGAATLTQRPLRRK